MAASAELTISPSTTRVGWIGTGVMGRSMCGHLLKAGYLADSSRVVASQSAVVFSIVGYPSDVRSVVLDPTTGALSGLCPGGVLVDMTTKNCSSIDAPVTGGGDLNIPIHPGPLFQLPPNLSRSCLWS